MALTGNTVAALIDDLQTIHLLDGCCASSTMRLCGEAAVEIMRLRTALGEAEVNEKTTMEDKTPIKILIAGDEFRKSLIGRADAHHGPAPLWYGWALMDAFKAGVEWARANSS
jgi:hypothetical protein